MGATGSSSGSSSLDGAIIRLTSSGQLDTGFNGTGIATLDVSGQAINFTSLDIEADGKVLLGGSSNSYSLISRFNTDGSVDTSFNATGYMTSRFGSSDAAINDLALQQSTGKLVAVGSSYSFTSNSYDFGVLQLGSALTDKNLLAVTDPVKAQAAHLADPADVAQSFTDVLNYQIPAGTFIDPDNGPQALSYSATLADGSALPSWIHFDATTQTFSGTPASTDFGHYQIKVTASDGLASTSANFTINVKADFIDCVYGDATERWNVASAEGTPIHVTYSFMTAAPSYASTNEKNTFVAMTDAEKAAVRQALSLIQSVCGIVFDEVTDQGAAASAVAGTCGQLRYGTCTMTDRGYAFTPGTSEVCGDVWISATYLADVLHAPVSGTSQFGTLIHETGHAIGLKHSGASAGDRNYLEDYGLLDDRSHSIMSYTYRDDTGLANNKEVQPSTPMLYDVAALQYMYGVNTSTNAGNTVYTYDPAAPIYQNIWDAGGTDTVDAHLFTFSCTVNLNQGAFSSLHTAAAAPDAYTYWGKDNLSISYNVIIENAIGGSGNDILIGNDVANVLTGNAGNDVLEGGLGNDTLDGGAGLDVASYQHATAAVVASLNGNTLTNATYGTDTLISIEGLMGSDYNDTLTGDSADNVLEGGLGNDILDGAGGNDTVAYLFATAGVTIDLGIAAAQNTVAAGTDTLSNFENVTGGDYNDTLSGNAGNNVLNGGAGDDTLSGNAGDDTLIGGRGNDSLTGGLGHDIFKYTNPDGTSIGGLGNDKIYDFTSNFDAVFDANEDVIDLSAFFSQNGITVDASNITHYVHMSTSTLGLMKIDTTAAGASGTAAYSFLTLSGTSNIFSDSNLANLIQAHQLIL